MKKQEVYELDYWELQELIKEEFGLLENSTHLRKRRWINSQKLECGPTMART